MSFPPTDDSPDTSGPRSRRSVLAALGAFAVGAGCSEVTDQGSPTPTDAPTPSPTPADGTPGTPGGEKRATRTPRDPDPLDASGAWRQRGADPGHTGATDATGVPDEGRVYWHLIRLRSGPAVVAEGRIFHYSEIGVDAGEVPTVTPTRDEPSTARPDFPTEPRLVARDASTGDVLWSQPLAGGKYGWPAVAEGRALAAVDGQLASFDAADGAAQWSRDLDGRQAGTPTVVGERVLVPVQGVVDGQDGTYVERPGIRAHDLADGSVRWTAEVPRRGNALAVDRDSGTVVVVSWDFDERAAVLGLSLADGAERWRTTTPGAFFREPVAVDGGPALVPNSDGALVALDPADGRERWSRELDGIEGVAADGETTYVGTDAGLYALATADGRTGWSRGTGGRGTRFTAPAVAGGTVYVGSGAVSGARVVAVDAGDGTERWGVPLPETVVGGDMVTAGLAAQPAVVDGGVYAFAKDGLYAFGLDGA